MSNVFGEEVLATLRRNGSDTTKAHRLDFFVYAPEQASASKAANRICECGFKAEVSRAGKRWLIVASKTLVPATADLAENGRFFEQIAEAVGGDFDGWEAQAVE
jgi:hypothetical protein